MTRDMLPGITPEGRESFYSRVDRRGDDECWNWLGTTSKGTAYFFYTIPGSKKQRYVTPSHVLYADIVGVPDEWSSFRLNSRCSTGNLCLNPSHKTATERTKSTQRSCKRGHDLTLQNAKLKNRGCRLCSREHQRNYIERVKREDPDKYEMIKKKAAERARNRPRKSLNEQALELLNG